MASAGRNVVVSVLFTLFGGPGILLVYFPWLLTHFRMPEDQPFALRALFTLVIACGLVPLLESIWRFIFVGRGTLVPLVPTERLVVSGLYRFVRNPMYVGVMTILAGEALLLRSLAVAQELAAVWLGMELFVRLYEEPRLMKTFPAEYDVYRRNVGRWLPRLTPWNGREI
jgi:protein-S-isoprenylcysteine O-methyltransferase Ste14